jgi:carboxypeptidase Q
MNKTVVAVAMLLSSTVLAAQEKVDMQMMQKIKDEEAQHSQIPMLAHYLTDVCGPRITNSPGYRKAVAWTVQTFQQWGLKNALPEAWGEFGKGWSNEHTYIAMKEPYYQPLIAYPAAFTSSTDGFESGEVLLLDKLDSATIDKLGAAMKGKIVMIKTEDTTLRSPFTADARRYEDSELNKLPGAYVSTQSMVDSIKMMVNNRYNTEHYLQSKGAIARLFFIPRIGGEGTVFAAGQLGYQKNSEPAFLDMFVSKEDYLRLQRLQRSQTKVVLEINVQNKWYTDDLTGYNVIAEIPGIDPKLKSQVVMLGGHLDSWHSGTGATDNAAGCIATMEAVRILTALGVQPKRTIRIALWGGEEQRLLGSKGYVKKHFGDPYDMKLTPEQVKVTAYFNLDNGTGKIRGVYLQNNEKVRGIFNAWLQPFADMDATGITGSNTGGTDHLSFDAVGIPAFQFIQDPMDYETRTHHTNMDVYDHLSIEDLKQSATILAAFVYNAAMRDDMLPRKPLPKP